MNKEAEYFIANLKKEFEIFDDKFYKEISEDIKKFDWVNLKKIKKYIEYLPEYMLCYYYEISVYKNDLNFFILMFNAHRDYFDKNNKYIFLDIATTKKSHFHLYFLLNQYQFEEEYLIDTIIETLDNQIYYSNALFLLKSNKINVSYDNNKLFLNYLNYQYPDNIIYKYTIEHESFDINNNTLEVLKCIILRSDLLSLEYLINKYKKEVLNSALEISVYHSRKNILDFIISKFNIKKIVLSNYSLQEIVELDTVDKDFIEYLINKKEYINYLYDFTNNGKLTSYLSVKKLGIFLSFSEPEIFNIIKNNLEKEKTHRMLSKF